MKEPKGFSLSLSSTLNPFFPFITKKNIKIWGTVVAWGPTKTIGASVYGGFGCLSFTFNFYFYCSFVYLLLNSIHCYWLLGGIHIFIVRWRVLWGNPNVARVIIFIIHVLLFSFVVHLFYFYFPLCKLLYLVFCIRNKLDFFF